jgi:DNA-binding transcriptional MerR regulator
MPATSAEARVVEKSPEAFRTISEVAADLDVPAHVLRFWESKFAQVNPIKRGGGRRYYRPEDVKLLSGIRHLLYEDKLTIKGVQKVLKEKGVRHVVRLGGDEDVSEGMPEAPATADGGATARVENIRRIVRNLEALRDRMDRG